MKSIYIVLLINLLSITFACAQKIYSTKAGAIKGYDPVAYFIQKQPIKGQSSITYEWNGATWHFANIKNMEVFKQNPEQYAPQYGGYCAYGLAKNYKVKIEPDCWSIENGKLYLNYDKSVQKDWDKDRANYIIKADKNWKIIN